MVGLFADGLLGVGGHSLELPVNHAEAVVIGEARLVAAKEIPIECVEWARSISKAFVGTVAATGAIVAHAFEVSGA